MSDIAGYNHRIRSEIIDKCPVIRRMTGYGTFRFRETAAGSHLRTAAALFGRAGVKYVTRWTFPAGGKQHGARTEPSFSEIARSIFVEESLNLLRIGCFAQC